jgi:tRNA nucleotidyltransferase (CCA-adding enzyme)
VNNDIKRVLNKLTSNGYQAYIVGGYVRDYILGIHTDDVDICTDAKPNELLNIFDNTFDNSYGGITFTKGEYEFDITTFREEIKYDNRRPVEFNYINDLYKDINRRDFTINAIYMDADMNIIDPLNGREDINNKIIRCVGNVEDKMREDPLRMLRAIRFKTIYDYEIESNLLSFIINNKDLIKTLSYTRRKEELDYIIKSNNRISGLKYIKELGLDDVLEISIPNNIKDSIDPLAIWAQMEFSNKYQFKKNELITINNIKSILSYGIIDNTILYKYGLYLSQVAGKILGIFSSYISSLYKELPIYSSRDIDITAEDIINILNIKPSNVISEVLKDIEINILDNRLNNNKEEIVKYVMDNWR